MILIPSFKLVESKPKGICQFGNCNKPSVGQVIAFFIYTDVCKEHGDEWSEMCNKMHQDFLDDWDRSFINIFNEYNHGT